MSKFGKQTGIVKDNYLVVLDWTILFEIYPALHSCPNFVFSVIFAFLVAFSDWRGHLAQSLSLLPRYEKLQEFDVQFTTSREPF